jgi:hypothetical protein
MQSLEAKILEFDEKFIFLSREFLTAASIYAVPTHAIWSSAENSKEIACNAVATIV